MASHNLLLWAQHQCPPSPQDVPAFHDAARTVVELGHFPCSWLQRWTDRRRRDSPLFPRRNTEKYLVKRKRSHNQSIVLLRPLLRSLFKSEECSSVLFHVSFILTSTFLASCTEKEKMLKHQTCLCYCIQSKVQAFDCQTVARIKKPSFWKFFGPGCYPGPRWGLLPPRPPQRPPSPTPTQLFHWTEPSDLTNILTNKYLSIVKNFFRSKSVHANEKMTVLPIFLEWKISQFWTCQLSVLRRKFPVARSNRFMVRGHMHTPWLIH